MLSDFLKEIFYSIPVHHEIHHFQFDKILAKEVIPEILVFLNTSGSASGTRILHEKPGNAILLQITHDVHPVIIGIGDVRYLYAIHPLMVLGAALFYSGLGSLRAPGRKAPHSAQ